MNLHMNPVYILIIGIALSSRNTCSNLLEMGALIYQKARTIQSEYTLTTKAGFIYLLSY